MQSMLDGFNAVSAAIGAVLWHPWVLYGLLAAALWFTVRTRFCQWKALTHGTAVIAGKHGSSSGPGAITHFQALCAALSATVGVGNIGGTALAISMGGPGAVFWMWVVGACGMALKCTEVALSMLYRDLEDPERPRGGPMWVAHRAFTERGRPRLGRIVAALFCVTLLVSTLTGGNFFQAWNVSDITFRNFGVPPIAVGVVLALLVGAVILGGIRRIGSVAGRIVPVMCGLYLLAALFVLVQYVDRIPEVIAQIFAGAFGELEGTGAFLGGTAGAAFAIGLQRGLFSNESGQGSSPIAHSAAKGDEPIREAVVAGLEPFIDTIIVCTLTAFVILSTGVWERDLDHRFSSTPELVWVDGEARLGNTPLTDGDGLADGTWVRCVLVEGAESARSQQQSMTGEVRSDDEGAWVEWQPVACDSKPRLRDEGFHVTYSGAAFTALAFDEGASGLGRWLVTVATWLFAFSTMISWSYYGEQGVRFLVPAGSAHPERWVLLYRLAFCACILVACSGVVRSQTELNNLTSLGTGVMLWVNLPLTVWFHGIAVRAWKDYFQRTNRG